MVASTGAAASGAIAKASSDQSRAQSQPQPQSVIRDRSGRDYSGRDQSGRDRAGQTQTVVNRSGNPRPDALLKERVDRAWGNRGASDNRDHTRTDDHSNKDNPYKRFCETYGMYRKDSDVHTLKWDANALPCKPLTCLLCPNRMEFLCREKWLEHVDEHHGGRQRYRDAYLSLAQLAPHVVTGQEWRVIVANFSEFYSRSARDWEKFTPEMQAAVTSGRGIPREVRWQPRRREACVFCARSHWLELVIFLIS